MAYNTVRVCTGIEDVKGRPDEPPDTPDQVMLKVNQALRRHGLRFVEHGGSAQLGYLDYRLEEITFTRQAVSAGAKYDLNVGGANPGLEPSKQTT